MIMIKSLSRFRHSWNRFWFRECSPHLLAIFRIAFAGFLVFYFSLQLPHVSMIYSREGVLLPMLLPDRWLTLVFTPPPAWVAELLFSSFFASLLCLTIGLGTRVSAGVATILYLYYRVISLYHFGTSFDRLFITLLAVLTFSGCGATFSVDMWFKRGSFLAWEPISILPQRLIAFQITATYVGVGWQKLYLPDWQSGDVLAWGFMGRWATPFGYWIARLNWPLWFYDILVWQVKFCEVFLPIGLWFKGWRWLSIAWGTLFHTLITLAMAIWWFQVLIPAYIVFFSPEEVFGLLQRVSRGKIH